MFLPLFTISDDGSTYIEHSFVANLTSALVDVSQVVKFYKKKTVEAVNLVLCIREYRATMARTLIGCWGIPQQPISERAIVTLKNNSCL